MSAGRRLREIFDAILRAKFPPEPKRKYDLIGEAMARPFGEEIGRGRTLAGGVGDEGTATGAKGPTGKREPT